MRSYSPARRRLVRAATAVAASIAGLLVWVVAVPLAGVDLEFEDVAGDIRQIGPAEIISFSIISTVAGWLLIALLEKLVPRYAVRIWTGVAVGVLVLSFLPLLSMGVGAFIALGVMHAAVGLVIIAAMRETRNDAARERSPVPVG